MSTSAPPTEPVEPAPQSPATPAAPPAARIGLVGPPRSGKSLLQAAITKLVPPPADIQFEVLDSLDTAHDALLYLCEAETDPERMEENLTAFADRYHQWAKQRGRDCEPAGLPLFFVLTKCDRLADAEATQAEWLEKVEAYKAAVLERLQALLQPGQPKGRAGFGTAALHVSAVAIKRPAGGNSPRTLETLGVVELFRRAMAEARAYAKRRLTQQRRVRTLTWGLAGLVAALCLLALIGVITSQFLKDKDTPSGPAAVPGAPAAPAVAKRVEELLGEANAVLRFEGKGLEPGVEERWSTWYQRADGIVQDLGEARKRLSDADKDLAARIDGALAALIQTQERSALFGLVNPKFSKRPALLRIPLDFTVPAADTRLRDLRNHYPTFRPAALPVELAPGAAQELHASARANHENLLYPARNWVQIELTKRLPGGKETRQAWRDLARGWLTKGAEGELGAWRQLALLLAQLAGTERPPDPLLQLNNFVAQEWFYLPLDHVELRLPAVLEFEGTTIRGLKPSSPLVVRLKSETGEVKATLQLDATGTPIAESSLTRYAFAVPGNGPPGAGILLFEPGDLISAQIELRQADGQGPEWRLTWPENAGRSMYSFSGLLKSPRFAPKAQNNPINLATGVRLVPARGHAFELPDLLPR